MVNKPETIWPLRHTHTHTQCHVYVIAFIWSHTRRVRASVVVFVYDIMLESGVVVLLCCALRDDVDTIIRKRDMHEVTTAQSLIFRAKPFSFNSIRYGV